MRRRRSSPIQSLARFINRLRFPPFQDYSNAALIDELRARGWKGSLLKVYDTDELAAELEARGWRVVGP